MPFTYVAQVLYRANRNSKATELPALVTESGLIISHLRYLAFNHARSQSWITKSVHALKLLIRWIQANDGEFDSVVKLLQSFVSALSTGTIDYEQVNDPMGLCWQPRQPVEVNNILRQVTQYTDWLEQQKGFEESRVNPWRKATDYEQRLVWCAFYHKKDNVFLSHLMTREGAMETIAKARQVTGPKVPRVQKERVFRFPEGRIDDFLYKGMVRSHTHELMPESERLDWKNIAITLLMHYGGLRISEVFHLYTCDISLDPNDRKAAQVKVYHPAYGQSPDPCYANRKEYLEAMGMKPRHTYSFNSRLFAGWKIPVMTDDRQCFSVFFAPDDMTHKFLEAWINYLKYQRVDSPKSQPHPFAFTNRNGEPETIANFRRMHRKAVAAIGLEPHRYNGTSEHGHRHSYGYRLADMGFDERFIQKAMHHNYITQ